MKLYTEEQVKKVVRKTYCGDFYDNDTPDDLVNELIPIELPSDEEIVIGPEWVFGIDRLAYWEGAKWVINHIKQQDK